MTDYISNSQTGYNQYNFELNFRNYLIAGNVNPLTIKNYMSDLRYFLGWFSAQRSSEYRIFSDTKLITSEIVTEYKEFLIHSQLPIKTINRRLSTVRKFCSFCISQGWMTENPAKNVGNVSSIIADPRSSVLENQTTNKHLESNTQHLGSSIQDQSLLDLVFEYENSLGQTKMNQKQVKKQMNNINEFLSIINSAL